MLSKKQKIKLVLDIRNGTIKKEYIPVFTEKWFLIAEKERCINNVFLSEIEFSELMEYIEPFGAKIYVANIETMVNFEKLLNN